MASPVGEKVPKQMRPVNLRKSPNLSMPSALNISTPNILIEIQKQAKA